MYSAFPSTLLIIYFIPIIASPKTETTIPIYFITPNTFSAESTNFVLPLRLGFGLYWLGSKVDANTGLISINAIKIVSAIEINIFLFIIFYK